MQTPGSPPRAARPGSLVLAEQANLPLNDLPVSFGHSSCSIDLLPETPLCVDSQHWEPQRRAEGAARFPWINSVMLCKAQGACLGGIHLLLCYHRRFIVLKLRGFFSFEVRPCQNHHVSSPAGVTGCDPKSLCPHWKQGWDPTEQFMDLRVPVHWGISTWSQEGIEL